MNRPSSFAVRAQWLIAIALLMAFAATYETKAQTPPAPNPAKIAVEQRQAVYKLLGANFKPIGDVLQGRAQFDAKEIQKRAVRVAFLSDLTAEAFPDVSNSGLPNTKAKADVWSNRADFDKRQAEFITSAKAFAQVAAKETTASDTFRAAAGALGQSCKGCHDNYREK